LKGQFVDVARGREVRLEVALHRLPAELVGGFETLDDAVPDDLVSGTRSARREPQLELGDRRLQRIELHGSHPPVSLRSESIAHPPPVREGVRISGELAQTSAPQHRADAVLLLGAEGRTRRLALVIEVQLSIDLGKRYSWPVYVAGIRARFQCPTLLLVVTPYRRVGKWAAQPIPLGPGGDVIQPLVLGPEAIPAVTDIEAARARPELSLLSAVAHAHGPLSIPIAMAAIRMARGLDERDSKVYDDVIRQALGSKLDRVLEALMNAGFEGYQYQSEFARKYVAEGKAEGKAEGEAAGEAKGRADALLAFLAARRLSVSEEQRATVLACRDLAQLDRWIARAASVAMAAELFG